jgi:hypothetical protein
MSRLPRYVPDPEDFPAVLRSFNQWIAYRLIPGTRKDGTPKTDKIPVDPKTGELASSTDPATWATFDVAHAYLRRTPDVHGLGFVVTESDPLVLVDLDHCTNPDGSLTPEAQAEVAYLSSWSEYSQSGEGIHVFCFGDIPENRKGDDREMYKSARFFAMTGRHVPGTPDAIQVATDRLAALHARWFPKRERHQDTTRPAVTGAIPDDADLLQRMFQAHNGAQVQDLYNGNWQRYYGDQSRADWRLCCALAFWTGKDAGRMDRIFRTSGLMRPKWDERHAADGRTYGELTIDNACSTTTDTFSGGRGGGDFRDWLQSARTFVRTVSFAAFIPQELKCKAGYRTDATDTKIADALLDLCEAKGTRTPRGSLEDLRRRANVGSRQTVANALRRLAGWFCDYDPATRTFVVRTLDTVDGVYKLSNLRTTNYSTFKQHDAFTVGTSRHSRERVRRGNVRLSPLADALLDALRERGYDKPLLPPLGESVLRVLDALDEHGALTRRGLVEVTGKTPSAIANATRKAEEFGLLMAWQEAPRAPKVYELHPDAWARVQELGPDMMTYLCGLERADRYEEAVQRRCEADLQRSLPPELERRTQAKLAEAVSRRREILGIVFPDWTDQELARYILEPAPRPTFWIERKHDKARLEVKMKTRTDRLHRRREEIELTAQLPELRRMAYAMAAD